MDKIIYENKDKQEFFSAVIAHRYAAEKNPSCKLFEVEEDAPIETFFEDDDVGKSIAVLNISLTGDEVQELSERYESVTWVIDYEDIARSISSIPSNVELLSSTEKGLINLTWEKFFACEMPTILALLDNIFANEGSDEMAFSQQAFAMACLIPEHFEVWVPLITSPLQQLVDVSKMMISSIEDHILNNDPEAAKMKEAGKSRFSLTFNGRAIVWVGDTVNEENIPQELLKLSESLRDHMNESNSHSAPSKLH